MKLIDSHFFYLLLQITCCVLQADTEKPEKSR